MYPLSLRTILVMLFCFAIKALNVVHADVVEFDATLLNSNQVVDFEEFNVDPFTPGDFGTNFDDLIHSMGVVFGQHFQGQTVSFNGDFDVLSTEASVSMQVMPGERLQNLVMGEDMITSNGTNVMGGLGPRRHPNLEALGEGAISVMFGSDQTEIGFELVGAGGLQGDSMFLQFFDSAGLNVGLLTVDEPTSREYAFRVNGATTSFRGFSMHHTEAHGFAIDNVRFRSPIPEPGCSAWLGLVLIALGKRRRKRG